MIDLFNYPNHPGFKEHGTSKAAAESASMHSKRLREIVLDTLRWQSLTADEVAAHLRLSVLSIRPRVSELARSGLIEKTGRTKKNISGSSAYEWRAK